MADWTVTLIERMDSRFTFTLTDVANTVTHSPQVIYKNRADAIQGATDMRDKLIGATTKTSVTQDFDPLA